MCNCIEMIDEYFCTKGLSSPVGVCSVLKHQTYPNQTCQSTEHYLPNTTPT